MKRPINGWLISAAAALIVGAAAAWAEMAPTVTLPATTRDHRALATRYDENAAAYHKEAAYHRAMLEEAGGTEWINPKAPSHPRHEKMRTHCEPIIRDAERLAREREQFAEWHRMRAAELEGR